MCTICIRLEYYVAIVAVAVDVAGTIYVLFDNNK